MMNKKIIELEWYQDPMSRDIRRAVLDVLRLHGPIDNPRNHTRINSVTKRVYGVFKAYQKGVYDDLRLEKCKKLKKKVEQV